MADFIDIVYSYSINAPEMRNDFRSAIMSYAFDYQDIAVAAVEDTTFDGTLKTMQKQINSKSLLDELDAFALG